MSLHPGPWPHRDNENGVLFYLEYIILKEMNGLPIEEDVAAFKSILEMIRTYDESNARIIGLFDRGPEESKNPNREDIRLISHDNMTAISAFDYLYSEGKEAEAIANWGIPGIRYDNAFPKKQRWKAVQWPTDIMFWGWCSKKLGLRVLTAPMMPFFLLRSFITCLSHANNTSGKLLNFVRLYAIKDANILGKLCWKGYCALMRRQYGSNWVSALMTIYFQNPEHPNRSLSAELQL